MMNDPIAKDKYCKLIEKIEWMSEFFYFVSVKLSVLSLVAPSLLKTFINYFIYNLNDESYILPVPSV